MPEHGGCLPACVHGHFSPCLSFLCDHGWEKMVFGVNRDYRHRSGNDDGWALLGALVQDITIFHMLILFATRLHRLYFLFIVAVPHPAVLCKVGVKEGCVSIGNICEGHWDWNYLYWQATRSTYV